MGSQMTVGAVNLRAEVNPKCTAAQAGREAPHVRRNQPPRCRQVDPRASSRRYWPVGQRAVGPAARWRSLHPHPQVPGPRSQVPQQATRLVAEHYRHLLARAANLSSFSSTLLEADGVTFLPIERFDRLIPSDGTADCGLRTADCATTYRTISRSDRKTQLESGTTVHRQPDWYFSMAAC